MSRTKATSLYLSGCHRLHCSVCASAAFAATGSWTRTMPQQWRSCVADWTGSHLESSSRPPGRASCRRVKHLGKPRPAFGAQPRIGAREVETGAAVYRNVHGRRREQAHGRLLLFRQTAPERHLPGKRAGPVAAVEDGVHNRAHRAIAGKLRPEALDRINAHVRSPCTTLEGI